MKTRRPPFRLGRCTAALVLTWLIAPGDAGAQDAEERIRRLEEQLRTLTQELKALKAAVQAPAPLPTATADTEAVDQAVRPTQPEAASAAAEASTLNERVQTLEQKVDQQGIQARFAQGILFEDPRGNWAIKLGGRVQLDYRDFHPDDAVADTFGLRRARFGVDATLLKDYRIVVEGEFANGNASGSTAQNVALTLGYFDVGWFAPYTRFRLGQFKPAFGYEQTLLDLYSDFMERGLQHNLLQNLNYDRGIMAYGSPYKGLWYGATVSNGVGTNLEERQGNPNDVRADSKEVTLRGVVNVAQLFDVPDAIVHLGGSFKQAKIANGASNPYVAATMQTEARGATFFTPAGFGAPGVTVSNIDRTFSNAEFLLSYGPVKVQGEYTQVEYEGARLAPGPELRFTRKLSASTVSAFWLITGEAYADFYRDAQVTKILPRNRFTRGKGGGWGAWEVGLRYSQFDGDDFSTSNPAGTGRLGSTSPVSTSTTGAHAVTAQLKWIPNVYTRFWFDYVDTRFDTPIVVNGVTEDKERAILLRGQIDF